MMVGKRLILEQGGVGARELLARSVAAEGNAGSFDCEKAPHSRGFFFTQDHSVEEATQLLSLLARFQLISSPMVELVLETGCL